MKRTSWQLAMALGISIWSTAASAQQTTAQQTVTRAAPQPVRTAHLAAADFGLATVSDAAEPAAEAPAPAPAPAAPHDHSHAEAKPGCAEGEAACTTAPTCTTPGCTSAGCTSAPSDCALDCGEAVEPWRLFSHCNDNCHGINFRGWVNGGIMGNSDSPNSRFNGPTTFYDRSGEGQLSQVYLLAEKALDTANGPAWGFRLDALYGSDYRFNISRGLSAEDNFTGKWNSSRFYGFDIPQAYAEVGVDDWSVKIGHFYTIIGYEVVTAPDNFFMTHAYTMQYGEPFTHTGILATKKVNDQLSLMGGITNGWDNFEQVYGGEYSFLGGATFTASDGNSKLAYAASVGEEEVIFGTQSPTETRFIQSLVYSRTITDRLNYVFQSDYGNQQNANNTGASAEWYGVNQYLFYKINCCWTAGVRAEWFRDDDGYRVAPAGDYAQTGAFPNSNPASIGGFEGNFYEVAVGLNYKPKSNSNLVIRPEVRYDKFDGTQALGARPFDDNNSNKQFIYGIDLIYLF
jgi:hypothetical protein